MDYLLDSNILLYAKMDAVPEHETVSKWLEIAVSERGNEIFISETSILSFLRIATNEKVFKPPLPTAEAGKFIEALLGRQNVHLLNPAPDHFAEVVNMMSRHSLSGNLVMDVHLAALALSIGATLVTRDRDFAKIPYLKVYNPLQYL